MSHIQSFCKIANVLTPVNAYQLTFNKHSTVKLKTELKLILLNYLLNIYQKYLELLTC